MTRDQVGALTLPLDDGKWGFGYGVAVLREPAAGSPFHTGTFQWGGVYGNHFSSTPWRS